MSKPLSPTDSLPPFPLFKKRIKPIDKSLTLLIPILSLFLLCFLYLAYNLISNNNQQQPPLFVSPLSETEGLNWGISTDSSSRDDNKRLVGFLEKGGEDCDLFQGKWIWDEDYPLYKEKDCLFLDQGFKCSMNGRRDSFYTKWRWQPLLCNLPRFNANVMLEKLRNRRVVFVGDSIGRNQWESLLCMLSSVIPDKDSIYEVNGNPITKHTGFLSFKFSDFNCTVEYYRAPFLVVQSRPPVGVGKEVKLTVKLDQMDWSSVHWRDADVLVFNTGHWWNYEKTVKGGSYFQEGNEVMMNMSVERAYQRSIETLGDWIGREVNTSKTQVLYRTYAPVHFRGGDWNTGGSCHMETLPDLDLKLIPAGTWKHLELVIDALSEHLSKSNVVEVDVLNVTQMSSWRKDGHASVYYLDPKIGPASLRRQDCSHWCLPGVPDAWNELLYALFLRREVPRSQKSMILS